MILTRNQTVSAGQQFIGTEFTISPSRPGAILRLLEVNLAMGSESKTWKIFKKTVDGLILVIAQSTVNGSFAANTVQHVLLNGDNANIVFERGDQIQIETTGASSEMKAKLYLTEVPV